MDSTTLTRTLKIMRLRGWIAERGGDDRRERRLRLAKAGEALLQRALPEWKNVQGRLRRQLGKQAWEDLARRTNQVAGVSLVLGRQSTVASDTRSSAEG